MSTYNSSPMSDDEKWGQIRNRLDVLGDCLHCRRRKVYALLTIYGDGSQLIRCKSCDATNEFVIHDEEYYDNAQWWKPLGNDDFNNYKENYSSDWEQANKRGKRKK